MNPLFRINGPEYTVGKRQLEAWHASRAMRERRKQLRQDAEAKAEKAAILEWAEKTAAERLARQSHLTTH